MKTNLVGEHRRSFQIEVATLSKIRSERGLARKCELRTSAEERTKARLEGRVKVLNPYLLSQKGPPRLDLRKGNPVERVIADHIDPLVHIVNVVVKLQSANSGSHL